jgi:exonuclease VII small subunit
MNNATRKQLASIIATLEGARARLEESQSGVEPLAEDERAKLDNMNDGLQASEQGQSVERAADNLDEAKDAIDEAMQAIENAVDKLNEASE